MSKKLLGALVSKDLHAKAHVTAKKNGKSLSDWLRELVEKNIDPGADIFLKKTLKETSK